MGNCVGCALGARVGNCVGCPLGTRVGDCIGTRVGEYVGGAIGTGVGRRVGAGEGRSGYGSGPAVQYRSGFEKRYQNESVKAVLYLLKDTSIPLAASPERASNLSVVCVGEQSASTLCLWGSRLLGVEKCLVASDVLPFALCCPISENSSCEFSRDLIPCLSAKVK